MGKTFILQSISKQRAKIYEIKNRNLFNNKSRLKIFINNDIKIVSLHIL